MCILSQFKKWEKREHKILIWKSFVGHGIPDLERSTGGKILWGAWRLPSHAGSRVQVLHSRHPKRAKKGWKSVMAFLTINRLIRSSWVNSRAREARLPVVQWRSDTSSHREDFHYSQWELMSHPETGSQRLIRNLMGSESDSCYII